MLGEPMSNVLPIRGTRRARLTAGQLFVDRYRLQHRLGQGGMGEVWAAKDEKIGRVVAIKLLHASLLLVPGYRERFTSECWALATLDHPNVVPLFDVGTEPQPYFVMKRILGINLREMLRDYGRIPWLEVVCFAIPIADGLAAAHRVDLWHRDVKPENIMVDEDGNVSILDLGIARNASASREVTDRIGTLGYMPPEMVQRQPTDHRGDLYQLGVLLYELLTGRKPYSGVDESSETEMQAAHVHYAPDPIEVDCPDGLRAIVLRLLEKKPEHRYQSARTLSADLGQVLRERGSVPTNDALEPLVHRAMVRRKLSRLAAGQEDASPPASSRREVHPYRVERERSKTDRLRMEPTQPMRSTLELGPNFVPVSPASPTARRAPQAPAAEPRSTVSILPGYVPRAPLPFTLARPRRRSISSSASARSSRSSSSSRCWCSLRVCSARRRMLLGPLHHRLRPRRRTSRQQPAPASIPASAVASAPSPAPVPTPPPRATVAPSASASAPARSAAPASAARSAAPARVTKRPPLPFGERPIF